MEIIKGQKKGQIELGEKELQRNQLNDQQEQNMITHEQVDEKRCQVGQVSVHNNTHNKQSHHSQQCKVNNKASQTLDMSQMSLKSAIVFLLLLSLVLVGVYKMIEQIYEIQHPELQLQRRIASSRVNMVRQENSLSDEKQQKGAQSEKLNGKVLNGDGDQKRLKQQLTIQQEKKQSQKQQLKLTTQKEQFKTKNSLDTQIQTQAQPIDKPQLSQKIIVVDNKQQQKQLLTTTEINTHKQPINHQKEESTKRQQAESELRQKEQYIQQFQDKEDKKQNKLQSSESQSNKDQAVDKDKTQLLNKELNKNVKVEKVKVQDERQAQKKGLSHEMINTQEKIDKRVQTPINTVNQQKPIEQSDPKVQQQAPVSNRIPHGKPKPRQSTQAPVSARPTVISQQSPSAPPPSKVFIPAAKAGISVEQALKWKSYQSMIQLPLQANTNSNPMLLEQYLYYQHKYNISQYTQLPICVVIPTYNNVQNNRYKDNLKSILQQNYTNYHVVVIDDKSQDNTGGKINQYVKMIDPKYKQKIKVIINEERKMAMPNLRYAAMNQCKQEELFIIVDGDDLLIGRQVFKLFSAVMQQRNYWVMWTNFLSPKGAIGYSRQYPSAHKQANNYRKAGFVMSHLRAYYTKLFRLIKDQDLKGANGEFFHAANDVAIGIPILQMAHKHVGYVPELNYYYNMYTGLNNHKVRLNEQKTNDKLIRKKPKYEALTTLGFGKKPPKIDKIPQNIPMNLKVQNP